MGNTCLLAGQRSEIGASSCCAADHAIAAIDSLESKEADSIFAGYLNNGFCEANLAGLILVKDKYRAFSIIALEAHLSLTVEQDHLEVLIRLPGRVIDDANLNLAFSLIRLHCDLLIEALKVLTSLGQAIYSARPECKGSLCLLLNDDGAMSVRLRDLVIQVLEAHSRAGILKILLLVSDLALLTLSKTEELTLIASGNFLAVHDPLNCIFSLRAVKQFVNSGLLRVLFEELFEVLDGVIDITNAHVDVRVVIGSLTLTHL